MAKPEKIDHRSRHNSRSAKYAKRLASRIRRRAAKRDPENASTRPEYLGWTT